MAYELVLTHEDFQIELRAPVSHERRALPCARLLLPELRVVVVVGMMREVSVLVRCW